MIKIPFKTAKIVNDGIDRKELERLELDVPPIEYEGEEVTYFWVRPDIILTVRPDKEDGGSLVDIGDEGLYESPLTPDEIADLINGTITIKA